MLKNSLYTIKQITNENNVVEAIIELNETHEIFKGHFPSQPVLPGVCMLQMTKEILEDSLHTKLQLIKADEIKFFRMIEPAGDAVLLFSIQYNLEENSIANVSARIMKNDIVCYKLKASYISQNI